MEGTIIMADSNKSYDLMFLGSFIDSIDDVREQFGEEYAEHFALRIVYYGVRRQKYCDMNSICNATLESIFPKIEKSTERVERKKRESIKRTVTKKEVARDENSTDEKAADKE